MKSKAVLTGLLLLLVFTSFSFKCDSGGSSPDNSPFRPAAKAGDDIAGAINAMIKVKRSLAQKGSVTPAEEKALTALLLRVNTADKEFVNGVKLVKNSGDASANKPKLCALFATLQAALSDLNNTGVLPVANPGAKSQLATALTTITNLLPAVTGVLQCS